MLRLTLDANGDTSTVAVKGEKQTRAHGPLAALTARLPFTGTPAMKLTEAGLWLLVAGIAVSLLARRRRSTVAAE
jgi:hypothetical protein